MSNGDAVPGGNISATIKHDGKDAPWIVVCGTPAEVKATLIETFGLGNEADISEWTTHDVVVEASRLAKAVSNAAAGLGGRPIGGSKSSGAWDAARNGEVPAATESSEPVVNPLIAAIEEATSVDALKTLWADNKAAFTDKDLMSQWKAKGKALQAASQAA